MSITKESVFENISSYDILNHYLQPYHNTGRLISGKNINNPFLAEKQKTPSFNIFCALPQHEWRYKDFATGDEGSCFDLVMKLLNQSFPEALETINRDHCLNLETTTNTTQTPKQTTSEESKVNFSVKKRPFNNAELAFWQKYGISLDTLQRYNVAAVEEFTNICKEGKSYNIRCNTEKFIFAYDNGSWLKLYKPLDEKQYKFQYLGTKEQGYIFGWSQLPTKGENIFITGGEKDVMSLAAQGFNAISLNSETATLEKGIADVLKLRFKNIIVLYDNDTTGVKQSELLVVEHNFYKITLPSIPYNGKDISDFFASGGSLLAFNELISASKLVSTPESLNPEKVVFNAIELMAMGNLEPQYLMAPIFPQKGTAVLAGKPDTGKSQFARQLCIQVAMGVKSFINFDLNPIHNRSIYVATEDNQENTRYLMSRQINGLNQTPKENLRFIFADTMEQEEILKSLDDELTKAPADLVVVDSFGDIFKGGDSNNNMAMRNTVKTFDKIAKKHSCLILFVHHINKGAYRQAPGQEHIQGGAGLLQKVRLGIQLSEGDKNTRYFTVVKGNYCPKEFKQNSIVLDFSEDTFIFTNTGKLIPTNELGTQPNEDKREEKFSELENIAEEIFSNRIVSYTAFVKKYCEITGKSVPTAKRVHTNLRKLEIIVEVNGSYRLSTPSREILSDDEVGETPF
ncbi:MAG: AAA family ATPase [Methylotenera sp.]|nr:AAA family ATPase [Flavobacterium sp.]